ncbi:MAG: T9SS type A sorting domain-containing protein [Saprospiraceae bacterium]|nr:T9SS type A sorting domain-containing protein [Saprospiraceae bacterium]
MKFSQHFLISLITLMLSFSYQSWATHLFSLELTYRYIGNDQYIIQVEAYQDCMGLPPLNSIGVDITSDSCNLSSTLVLPTVSAVDITPVAPCVISPCMLGSYGLLRVIYSDTVTLDNCEDWVISYTNCCRTPSIVNLANTNSSLYTYVTLDNSSENNYSTGHTGDGYVYACINTPKIYYPHAYDLDGDSLVFSLTAPLGSNGVPEPFGAGFSASNPFGTGSSASIDPNTGAINFVCNTLGDYTVGYQIEEYRNGVLVATSNREVLFYIYSCNNYTPDFTVSNVQGGLLLNNVFYVDDPSQLTFDITATDPDALDSLFFTSDISTIGGSFSASGVNPSIASFVWPKSSPIIQEFMVLITDNFCNPSFPVAAGAHRFGFAIQHTDCMPDTITGVVAADSVFAICSDCPHVPLLSIDTIYSSLTTSFGSLSLSTNKNGIDYHAGSSHQVQDDFWVYFGVNGGQWQDSVWVEITTVSCVWAGDADTNKVVNHFDLLPIGLGYGETGPLRDNADNNYDCEPALNFLNSTPVTATNYKHADTDGNGIVDVMDTTAIVLNWGQIHLKNSSSTSSNAIPFYVQYATGLPGQVMQIPIILGDTSVAADSIYGIAFTINYDETMTDTNSVSVDFSTSWLGTINSDMISVQKDYYYQGHIDVSVVRVDHTNRSGMGQIGTLVLTIKDDILKSTNQRLDMLISNVRIITNVETERTASTPPTDILITTPSATKTFSKEAINISVFPNPANTFMNINSNDEIQQIMLYNPAGQLLYSLGNNAYGAQLNIRDLNSGIYILQVQTLHGFTTKKVQIIR